MRLPRRRTLPRRGGWHLTPRWMLAELQPPGANRRHGVVRVSLGELGTHPRCWGDSARRGCSSSRCSHRARRTGPGQRELLLTAKVSARPAGGTWLPPPGERPAREEAQPLNSQAPHLQGDRG